MPPLPPDAKRRANEVASEDFLFHLYRGSELLQDNRVHEAKEELELAIRLQPLDPKGQDLLGVVYFRLGMYPRAIEIFEQLVREYPEERTPRVNLALCYLKTGQALIARQLLEETVLFNADNARAWGYLGLAYERLGDYMKAREAFGRGGHDSMARRMDELLAEQNAAPRSRRPPSVRPPSVRPSPPPGSVRPGSARPSEPFHELDDRQPDEVSLPPLNRLPSAPPPVSLGAARVPSILPPSSGLSEPPAFSGPRSLLPAGDFARERLLIFPAIAGAVQLDGGFLLVTVSDSFICRPTALRGYVGLSTASPRTETLPRVVRGRRQDDSLGGPSPLLAYAGLQQLLLGPTHGRSLHAFTLGDEVAFCREDLLVGFDGALSYENGRLAVGDGEAALMVQLRGSGPVVLEAGARIGALEIREGQAATVRRESVVGWVGRLVPRALMPSEAPAAQRGLVSFSGDGLLLVELPPPPA